MLSPHNFVEARLYQNEEVLIHDALRHLLRARPELKIQLAVYQYKEKKVSLAKAADLAGISWAQMKDVLTEQNIPLRLGPETVSEALEEIQSLREELESRS